MPHGRLWGRGKRQHGSSGLHSRSSLHWLTGHCKAAIVGTKYLLAQCRCSSSDAVARLDRYTHGVCARPAGTATVLFATVYGLHPISVFKATGSKLHVASFHVDLLCQPADDALRVRNTVAQIRGISPDRGSAQSGMMRLPRLRLDRDALVGNY